MAPAIYDFSIVPMKKICNNLLHIMGKAEQYAKEKGVNVDDYIKLQIHPDMKDFTYQIQRLSDAAKFVVVRVGGTDPESVVIPDEEKSWDDLKTRLEKTIKILEGADAKSFEGKDEINVSLFNGKYNLTAHNYVVSFAIPNFYFHVTTAYDLLRGQGVPIGKMDFLAGQQP